MNNSYLRKLIMEELENILGGDEESESGGGFGTISDPRSFNNNREDEEDRSTVEDASREVVEALEEIEHFSNFERRGKDPKNLMYKGDIETGWASCFVHISFRSTSSGKLYAKVEMSHTKWDRRPKKSFKATSADRVKEGVSKFLDRFREGGYMPDKKF
jgi:hypothetical protein